MSDYDAFDNVDSDSTRRGIVAGRYDRIMIPEAPLTVSVRLIPGKYQLTVWEDGKPSVKIKPFFESARHVLQPKAGRGWEFLTCPRGLNEYEDPVKCPLCNFLDGREGERNWFSAHTVLGLANYHKVDVAPKPGSRQKKAYKRLIPCEVTPTNPNCKYCAAKYEWQRGYLGHFSTSLTDYSELKRLNREMGAHCVCGGTIFAHQAACPTCHTVLADVESGISDSDFQKFLVNKQVCPTCRVIISPVPVHRCTTCSEPRKLSIYDANIRLWREQRNDFKVLKGDIVSWGPLDSSYGEVEPLDLPAIYAPEHIGRLSRRVPGYRSKVSELAQDPNAVSRMPMEIIADLAQAAGAVAAPPLPPGIFGPSVTTGITKVQPSNASVNKTAGSREPSGRQMTLPNVMPSKKDSAIPADFIPEIGDLRIDDTPEELIENLSVDKISTFRK